MKQLSNWLLVILHHKKYEVTEVVVPQVAIAPISVDIPNATLQQTPAATPEHDSATLEGGSAVPT